MLDYFVDLFKKPQYQWSLLDSLAFVGLIIGVLIVIGIIWFVIWFIRELKKEKRFKTCEGWCLSNKCWNHKYCLGCIYYKKKQLTYQHEDKGE